MDTLSIVLMILFIFGVIGCVVCVLINAGCVGYAIYERRNPRHSYHRLSAMEEGRNGEEEIELADLSQQLPKKELSRLVVLSNMIFSLSKTIHQQESDRCCVATFNEKLLIGQRFNSSISSLLTNLTNICTVGSGGGSSFYDSLVGFVKYILKYRRKDHKAVILVFCASSDDRSNRTFEDCEKNLSQLAAFKNVKLVLVGLGKRVHNSRNERMMENAGGEYIHYRGFRRRKDGDDEEERKSTSCEVITDTDLEESIPIQKKRKGYDWGILMETSEIMGELVGTKN